MASNPRRRNSAASRGILRSGDLVKVAGERRLYVVLPVTGRDLARGINAETRGLHLFGGFWYPGPALSLRSYGKIMPLQGWRVGHVRGRWAALRHCR